MNWRTVFRGSVLLIGLFMMALTPTSYPQQLVMASNLSPLAKAAQVTATVSATATPAPANPLTPASLYRLELPSGTQAEYGREGLPGTFTAFLPSRPTPLCWLHIPARTTFWTRARPSNSPLTAARICCPICIFRWW